jgi:1-deoxy-D-xylulose-5-phosphate reductoisomerase
VGNLGFEAPDHTRYPGLQLAWDTLAGPHGSTAVLNAANEEAVAAFLGGRIRFDQIHAVNAQTLADVSPEPDSAGSIEALLELDLRARRSAASFIQEMQGMKGQAPC